MRSTVEIQKDLTTARQKRALLRIDMAAVEGKIEGLQDELEFAETVEAHATAPKGITGIGVSAVARSLRQLNATEEA